LYVLFGQTRERLDDLVIALAGLEIALDGFDWYSGTAKDGLRCLGLAPPVKAGS